MNIMLVSVKERTAEIGIRRAIGATQKDILIQFLSEAMTLTGLGGIIGIAVGLLLAFAFRLIVSFPAVVPIWAVVAGFVASILVGLVAGLYPALRAAKLDPVEAMRTP
jgi:putative ABC transport system permease protein